MNNGWMSELSELNDRARELVSAGDVSSALMHLSEAKKLLDNEKHAGNQSREVKQAEKTIMEMIAVANAIGEAQEQMPRGPRHAA